MEYVSQVQCYYCGAERQLQQPSKLPPWMRDLSVEQCSEIWNLAVGHLSLDDCPVGTLLAGHAGLDYADVDFVHLKPQEIHQLFNHCADVLVAFIKRRPKDLHGLLKRLGWLPDSMLSWPKMESIWSTKPRKFCKPELVQLIHQGIYDLTEAYSTILPEITVALSNFRNLAELLKQPTETHFRTWERLLTCQVDDEGRIQHIKVVPKTALEITPDAKGWVMGLQAKKRPKSRARYRWWLPPTQHRPTDSRVLEILKVTILFLRHDAKLSWFESRSMKCFGKRPMAQVYQRMRWTAIGEMGSLLYAHRFPTYGLIEAAWRLGLNGHNIAHEELRRAESRIRDRISGLEGKRSK